MNPKDAYEYYKTLILDAELPESDEDGCIRDYIIDTLLDDEIENLETRDE